MPLNVVDKPKQSYRGENSVISARKSAEILGLSKAVFFSAIDSGIIECQAKIQDSPDDKPAYGFNQDYLKEVLKILPKNRSKTQKVFNAQVKERIATINKRWRTIKQDYMR